MNVRRALFALAAAGLAGAAFLATRQAQAFIGGGGGAGLVDAIVDAADDAAFSLSGYRLMSSRWQEAAARPENLAFVNAAHDAEMRHGVPRDLFVRLLWQESRFDPSAHNAGSDASGIAQIVPRWHPGVDPFDPIASIHYGAGYLAQQFRAFGSWELALKAYNWGPGNVRAWLASRNSDAPMSEPLETQNYSAQILADLAETGRLIA